MGWTLAGKEGGDLKGNGKVIKISLLTTQFFQRSPHPTSHDVFFLSYLNVKDPLGYVNRPLNHTDYMLLPS